MPEGAKPGSLELLEQLVESAAQLQKERAGSAAVGQAPPPPPPPSEAVDDAPAAFYVYKDRRGTEHIVDALELVPAAYRGKAKKWLIERHDGGGTSLIESSGSFSTVRLETPPAPREALHLPSLLIGAVAATAICLGALAWRTRARRLVVAVLLIAAALLGGGAYIGWMRRQTGLGEQIVATPSDVIENARDAAQRVEEKMRQDMRALERIDQSIADETSSKRRR